VHASAGRKVFPQKSVQFAQSSGALDAATVCCNVREACMRYLLPSWLWI
jgi:hypothetical protein